MIDRLERAVRRMRHAADTDLWTARLLGLGPRPPGKSEPGLVIVQIDGLSRARLLEAIAAGRVPFLRSLVARGSHEVTAVFSGLPSTTPAVQAELFYGVANAVPAFAFIDHESGRLSRMYEADAVRSVEKRLAESHAALLAGGGSYLNVFDGGAAHPRFCMASLGWGDVQTDRKLGALAVAALRGTQVLRATAAVAAEGLRGLRDLAGGLRTGQDVASEIKFAQSRVVIGVVLRELCAFAASIDLARGAPVVHVNLLGYDEMAHRRGPDSALARATLPALDATIRRLHARATRSARRDYDLWVMADHGQEATTPYPELHGRTVRDAITEAFAAHGLATSPHEEPREGEQRFRARALGERLIGILVPGVDITTQHRVPDRVTVVAQGPLGHVYCPAPPTGSARDELARSLVERAHVPLVCAADGPGRAVAWTADGVYSLPREIGRLIGDGHPYPKEVAHDLVAICHHRDAGHFVISGWHPAAAVSFTHENGSHSGPGTAETDAFVLAPVGSLPAGDALRFADVRAAAREVLERRGVRPLRRRPAADAIRLVTYNVHGCVGMDGVLSPERIARTLARLDPDIVALQELDVQRARSGGVDQAHEIARHLSMELCFHPTITVAEERFGDAVLSRLPMREIRRGTLPALGGALEPRGALWVDVETGDGPPLSVITTHLSLHPRERWQQARALLGPEWLGDPRLRADAVLCGDFNALSWFPSCRRIGRRLTDATSVTRDRRAANTWFGRFPIARIDHVFVTSTLEVRHVEVPDDERSRVASDHRPLVVDLAALR